MGSDALIIFAGERYYLVSDGRYENVLTSYSGPFEPVIRKNDLASELERLIPAKTKQIALEYNHTELGKFTILKGLFPFTDFMNADEIVNQVSSVMDNEALKHHKKASDIVRKTVLAIGEEDLIGKTEKWIKGRIIQLLYEGGADELSFDPIVAAGKNTANPHHKPGNTKVKKNDILMVDLGCSINGVCSDITRMLTPEFGYVKGFDAVYDFVLDMLIEAGEFIRPGMKGGEVDKVLREKFHETGFDEFFPHALGHGVGYDIHFYPRIGTNSEDVISEGQLLAIEPAVYFPGKFGIRIEDNFLVTADGCDNLTRF